MTRAAAKRVTITPRTDNGALDGRYPNGVPPAPPDITVSQSIPDAASIPAGSAYSNDLSVYVSGTGTAGAVYSIEQIVGTMAGIGLSFSGTTLSGSNPTAGSASLRLRLDKSGYTFRSNTFARTVTAAAPPDIYPPTIGPPPEATVISSSAVNVTTQWPMDPQTPAAIASGMASLQWQRSSNAGSFINVGSPIAAPGLGELQSWTQVKIGANPVSDAVTQVGPDFNFSVSAGAVGSTADVLTGAYITLSGNFDFFAYIPAWTASGTYDEAGIMLRQSLDPASAMVQFANFVPSGGAGVGVASRSALGAVKVVNGGTASNLPTNRWVRLQRSANVITASFKSASVEQWTTLSSVTLSLSDPIYLLVYACRNATGTSVTPSVQRVTVNLLGDLTLNDTGLAALTTVQYRTTAKDVQGNASTSDTSLAVTTSSSGGTIKKNFGSYAFDITRPSTPGTFAGSLFPIIDAMDAAFVDNTSNPPKRFIGVQFELSWFWIENAAGGTPDWTIIDQVLAKLAAVSAARGVDYKLIIYFEGGEGFGKTPATPQPIKFSGTTTALSIAPDFIINGLTPGAGPGVVNGFYGQQCIAIWRQNEMTALINILTLMGARYDANPHVEMLIPITETGCNVGNIALPANQGGDPTYSGSNLVTQLKRLIVAMKTAWPTTSKCLFNNWVGNGMNTAQLVDLSQFAVANGWGMGGPDILYGGTGGSPTAGDNILTGAAGFGGIDYRGTIPINYQDQANWGAWTNQTQALTLNYAIAHLKATHVVFEWSDTLGPAGTNWQDTLNALNAANWPRGGTF